MGKMSRTKGHSFERAIAIDFQELGWTDARRQLEYHIKDALGVDLQGVEPFAVQCKRGRGYAPINAIEEIKGDRQIIGIDGMRIHSQSGSAELSYAYNRIPLLITKADNKPTMAVLPWAELKKLLQHYYAR